ncbi:MAG: DUF2190 family protein [Planctomycetes bacterium]|nr:DUF2190 family protein [Planctomycetota bacterium]
MGATYIHDGQMVDYQPTAIVTFGQVVVQNDLVGVANLDIPANVLGALMVSGVFDVPKASGAGTAIAAGATVYWDEADQQAKTDDESGANKRLGKTVAAATDDDTTVRVRLSQ